MRLDKMLADAGLGTRREVKDLIRKGRISRDGRILKDPGESVQAKADIRLDGKSVVWQPFEYWMLNKPAGIITASRDRREKTVLDLIRTEKRRDLFPVGRLDRDTEGLLLITNDGQLSHRLLSPAHHVKKWYLAAVSGELTEKKAEQFRTGVDIGDEKPTRPAGLKILRRNPERGETWVEVTLTEGRYHEIKRMFEALQCRVTYLKRTRMGTLALDPELSPGSYRKLTEDEIADLKGEGN